MKQCKESDGELTIIDSGPGMWSGCVSAKVTFEQKLEEEKERTYLGAVPQAGDTVSAKALR